MKVTTPHRKVTQKTSQKNRNFSEKIYFNSTFDISCHPNSRSETENHICRFAKSKKRKIKHTTLPIIISTSSHIHDKLNPQFSKAEKNKQQYFNQKRK